MERTRGSTEKGTALKKEKMERKMWSIWFEAYKESNEMHGNSRYFKVIQYEWMFSDIDANMADFHSFFLFSPCNARANLHSHSLQSASSHAGKGEKEKDNRLSPLFFKKSNKMLDEIKA